MANDEAVCRRQIQQKEAQKRQLQKQNDRLREEVERLKEARNQVRRLKGDYKEISSQVKKTVNGHHDWKGNRYDRGKRLMNTIVQEDKSAVAAIDRALDTLEREITRKQNEINGNTTLIQRLVNSINSLWAEIRALTN